MVIIKVNNGGVDWFLKSTTWTSSVDRADKFDNSILAMSAALKAKKFMKPSVFKKIKYIAI